MAKKTIYYWLVCHYQNAGGGITWEEVVLENSHPFDYIRGYGNNARLYTIVNWKEITKTEYELFAKRG